jgi:hypothetical protein
LHGAKVIEPVLIPYREGSFTFLIFLRLVNLDRDLTGMKKELLSGFALLFFLNGPAQIFHGLPSSGYNSSGAYSTQFADAFSCTANPSCLGAMNHVLIGALAENKWMLQGLNNYALAASFPLNAGGAGLVLQQSGDEDFKETGLELAYGKNLGKLEIGIDFNYLRDMTAGYGSVQFVFSGFGLRYRVNEKFISGWELGLPVSGKAGKTNPERAPQYFRMGFGYTAEDDLFLSLQISKQSDLPMELCGYVEYRYEDHFVFSAGINSLPGSIYFKSGWKKNRLCIQLSLAYEPVLGISPGLIILCETKNKSE